MEEPEGGGMSQIIAELACEIAEAARAEGLKEARLVGLDTNIMLSTAEIFAIYDGAQLLLTDIP